jgi:hypothetical protein
VGGSTHEVATSSFTFDTLNRLTDVEYKKGGVAPPCAKMKRTH